MNRTWIPIIAGSLLFLGATAHGETIPEHVDINLQQTNPALSQQWQDKKEVKEFTHMKHIKMLEKTSAEQDTCLSCHKEADNRAEIHNSTRKDKQLKTVTEAGGVKKYMHGQCITCHKSLKKQKQPTGPTSCKGCH